MKKLGEFLVIICILGMSIVPTSVFGNIRTTKASNSIISITDRPIITNGQISYFQNSYTNSPFLFLEGQTVKINLEFGEATYCEIGIMESTNPILSTEIKGSKSSSITFDNIPKTSNHYGLYIINYGLDPIIINDFNVQAIDINHYYLNKYMGTSKIVYVGDDYQPSSASVVASGYNMVAIDFSISDSDNKVITKKIFTLSDKESTYIIDFNKLPKGSYILRSYTTSSPWSPSPSIYDMRLI